MRETRADVLKHPTLRPLPRTTPTSDTKSGTTRLEQERKVGKSNTCAHTHTKLAHVDIWIDRYADTDLQIMIGIDMQMYRYTGPYYGLAQVLHIHMCVLYMYMYIYVS